MTLKGLTILCGILGATAAAACSSTPAGDTIGNGDKQSAGGGNNGGGANAGAQGCDFNCGTGGTGSSGITGAGGFDDTKVCGGDIKKAEALPVDMYIMFDQSSSMNDQRPDGSGTWWTAAQAGVTSFVGSSRASGMGVGLQYFPLSGNTPGCSLKSGIGDCCSPGTYQTPEVDVGLLPANAAALTASIQKHQPTAFTPTSAALQGAIDYMKAWAPNHLGRAPVVVLVTDGFPTECAPQDLSTGVDTQDLVTQVTTAVQTEPKVRTFVVGINLSQGKQNLDRIAKAGGTAKAFLIDAGNISDAFTNAMLSIANTPLDCALDIPKPTMAGMVIDPDLVDVRYTPSATGVTDHVQKLNNAGDCDASGGFGWYYDSPAMPTKILVCPGTCASFAAGSIETVNGCKPTDGIAK
jgi:hypothetical protein